METNTDRPNDPFVHTTRPVLTADGKDGTSYVMENGEPEDVAVLRVVGAERG